MRSDALGEALPIGNWSAGSARELRHEHIRLINDAKSLGAGEKRGMLAGRTSPVKVIRPVPVPAWVKQGPLGSESRYEPSKSGSYDASRFSAG